MRHQNSVLHGLLKQIPWSAFDRLVEEHGADRRARRLSTKSQLVALLYGQLSGASSLREIEAVSESHAARLYHLGAAPVSRSTLAEANAQRPHEVFSGLLTHLVGQARRGVRRDAEEAVRLVDSSPLRLSRVAAWARFCEGTTGAKLHLVLDPDAGLPLYLEVTPARVNDITVAQTMPIEPGATYVFDLGYYDYAFWEKLDAAGCRLVTRLKRNTRIDALCSMPVPKQAPDAATGTILSDAIGYLPKRQGSGRNNPFADPVRVIEVRIETGKILRIVSNDLKAPATEIAALYKRRWAIELFFRWVKQTLKIGHFLGTSENAVRIQIAVALIAYLLLLLARATIRAVDGPLGFARLVRANLMHRRPLDRLRAPPPDPIADPRQFTLALSKF